VTNVDLLAFRDRAVYLPAESTLVCADVHLGRATASTVQSNLGEHDELCDRFKTLVTRFTPKEIVIAGDLLHSFSSLSQGVAQTLQRLEATADAADARMIVTPGNHDTMLAGLWDGPTETEYRVGNWAICHGHEPPETVADGYLVGHDHPALEIEGQRHPCYLYGEEVYQGADLLMLPAFTRTAAGVAVNEMLAPEFQSPLVTDVGALRPFIRDTQGDETLTFPSLDKFRRFL
jgi:putative SbcD/Mre11-related phosphoesterase